MWWKKEVKAGVMLYALLIVAVFSLLLQFYLNRQVAVARNHKAGEESLIAYSMAHLTKQKVVATLRGEREEKEQKAQEEEVAKSDIQNQSKENQSSQPPSNHQDSGGREKEGEEEAAASPPPPSAPAQRDSSTTEGKTEEKSLGRPIGQGQVSYNHGQTNYQLEDQLLRVEVQLATGKTFRYSFHIDSEKP